MHHLYNMIYMMCMIYDVYIDAKYIYVYINIFPWKTSKWCIGCYSSIINLSWRSLSVLCSDDHCLSLLLSSFLFLYRMRMYIWNNIFFSFACDSREHYEKYGGDEAAYAAASLDLKGVEMYNKLDIEGLHTLGTVVVDYRGYRIIAQSIIPGILQREQENSVVYGSVDGGKTIATHEKFLEKVSEIVFIFRFLFAPLFYSALPNLLGKT